MTIVFIQPESQEPVCTLNSEQCPITRGDVVILPTAPDTPFVVVQRGIIFEKRPVDVNNLQAQKAFDVVIQLVVVPQQEACCAN